MTNETIGKIILTFISTLSIVGISSILYSLLFEKDVICIPRPKPNRFYPHQQDLFDTKIETILNNDDFDIDDLSDNDVIILD